jgi:hypothetical protein
MYYGLAHSGFKTAYDHWLAVPASYHLSGWQPGALAFFSGGASGHIAIGDVHLGKTYTTDLPKDGYVGHKSVNDIEAAWGKKFLGWTKPYF